MIGMMMQDHKLGDAGREKVFEDAGLVDVSADVFSSDCVGGRKEDGDEEYDPFMETVFGGFCGD